MTYTLSFCCVVAGTLVLSLGCGGSPRTPAEAATDSEAGEGTPAEVSCSRDDDCGASLFCDLGTCRSEEPNQLYGMACQAAPSDGHKQELCGAYVCQEGRCRSCVSDAQCEAAEVTCRTLPGRPGKRCGRTLEPSDATAEAPSSVEPAARTHSAE